MKTIVVLITGILLFCTGGCDTSEKDWIQTKFINTVQTYSEFIAKHPDSELAEQALLRIEDLYFKEAQVENTVESYSNFLVNYPSGTHPKNALEAIENIHFEEARSENTIAGFQRFLSQHPSQTHSENARATLEQLKRVGIIQGQVLFECNNQTTTVPYQVYLFKEGGFKSIKRTKLDEGGEFSFNNLWPGSYELNKSDSTGNFTFTSSGEPSSVVAGETSNVTLFSISCPEIMLVSPVENASVQTTQPIFQWEPYDGATQYVVFMYGETTGYIGRKPFISLRPTTNTSTQYSENLEPGDFSWKVCINPKPARSGFGYDYTACSLKAHFKIDARH